MVMACTQERSIVPADAGLTAITATHSQAATRSSLEVDESGETASYSILWDAPDKILVGYAGAVSEFTSTNTERAEEATFTGKLPEGSGSLYGIYPSESDNTVDADGTYKIIFHHEQTAVEGSYDPMAFPAVAVSDTKSLSFMNVLGLLELTVGYDDVTSIIFTSYSDESFSRATRSSVDPVVFYVQIKDGEPAIVGGEGGVNGYGSVVGYVLNAPKDSGCFTKDAPYYMAVPPITGWMSDIYPLFVLLHSDGSITQIKLDSQPILERSKVHQVKKLVAEEPTDPYNGHEYVDLGLPSGLKWATCNIGADSPEGLGDYFAWGETETKEDYSWETYKWMQKDQNSWEYITKYSISDYRKEGIWFEGDTFVGDNGDGVGHGDFASYDYVDDPAVQIWGGTWRTPTADDYWELIDNTTAVWTKVSGVEGYLFTGINDKTLFLPAAGTYMGAKLSGYSGSTYIASGFYWTSSLISTPFAYQMYFSKQIGAPSTDVSSDYRCYGASIRPVAE